MNKRQAEAAIKFEGWTRTRGSGYCEDRHGTEYPSEGASWVMLTSEEYRVALVFNLSGGDVSGSTFFENGDGWFCFDRRGIEQSFYASYDGKSTWHEPLDVPAIVAAQLERVANARATGEQEPVPGLGGSRHRGVFGV